MYEWNNFGQYWVLMKPNTHAGIELCDGMNNKKNNLLL